MSPEKKVFLLFLCLIVLMASCVYTHVDGFKEFLFPPTTKEVKVDDSKEQNNESEEKIETKESKNNETPIEKPIEELKTTDATDATPSTIDNTEDSKTKDDTSSDSKEIVEENIEPLITTDKRYTRIGSEKNIEELSKESQLLQIKMTDYVRENPIIFKRGSNKITKKSNATIKSVVEALKEFENVKIEIAGHTDAIGARKLNQSISLKRAKTVRDRLIDLGIDGSRMKARGYGEDIPLVKNSPKGYSKINRRVEFNIVEE